MAAHEYASAGTDTGHAAGGVDASWASQEDCRFRVSCDSRDDRGWQGDGEGILWRGCETLLLCRLLEWRATSVIGSAALSGRLRWNHCGRAGELLDAPACQLDLGHAGHDA